MTSSQVQVYHNLTKIGPSSKINHPPFLNEAIAKGTFLSKIRPLVYAAVHEVQEASKK